MELTAGRRLIRLFKPNVKKMQAQKNVNGLLKTLEDRDAEVREEAARALGELRFPRAVMPLCRTLKDSEWTVRLTAVDALGQFNDVRSIEPLVDTLKDEKPAVHQAAAEVLVKCGDRAVNSLTRALTDQQLSARRTAAWALGQIGERRSVPALIAILDDPEPAVRETAALTLGQLKDKRAIEPLCALLRDSHAHITQAALHALQEIGLPTNPGFQALYAVARKDWSSAVALGSDAVDALVDALSDPDDDVRRDAARSLGMIPDSRVVEPLIRSLQDERWYVREAAAWSLGRSKDPAIVDQLIAALKDHSAGTREAAAKALGDIADPRAVLPLIQVFSTDDYHLKEDEYYVVEAAVEALAQIGQVALEPLLAAFKTSNPAARHDIAVALDKIGVPEDDPVAQAWHAVMKGNWSQAIHMGEVAIEPLIAALKDVDHRVRRSAAEALAQLAPVRAVTPLCETLRDRKEDVRRAAANALVQIGAPALISVHFTMNDDEWTARQGAAWVLASIGDRWSLAPLCEALHDDNFEVAQAAAEALDHVGMPDDPTIIGWYAVAKRDWALATRQGKRAVAPLSRALMNENADVRWAAARALGRISDPDAADALRAVLRDEEAYVREAAADALARMHLPATPPEPASDAPAPETTPPSD